MKQVKLDLGCGEHCKEGFIGIDIIPDKGVKVHDLNKGIPYLDNSVDEIYCSHFLEHADDPDFIINEVYRVLKPDGIVTFKLPHAACWGATADPTHKHIIDANRFCYYIKDTYWNKRYKIKTKFGLVKYGYKLDPECKLKPEHEYLRPYLFSSLLEYTIILKALK